MSFSNAIDPASNSISFDKSFNNVDFPAPFLPIRPTLSPEINLKEISSNKYSPEKETERL